MRTMFANAASYPSTDIFMLGAGSDDPINFFPDFALKNWNQAPVDDYQKADSGMAKTGGSAVPNYHQRFGAPPENSLSSFRDRFRQFFLDTFPPHIGTSFSRITRPGRWLSTMDCPIRYRMPPARSLMILKALLPDDPPRFLPIFKA